MFAGLPTANPRRRKLFLGALVAQSATIFILISLGIVQPAKFVASKRWELVPLVSTPPPVNHQPQKIPPQLLTPRRELQPRVEAKLEAPPPTVLPQPREMPRFERPQPIAPQPAVQVGNFEKPMTANRAEQLKTGQEKLKTGMFSTGSSATPNSTLAASKVQTGGFGDPNGIPATGDNKHRVNIAAVGSFDLPGGPGYGNGTGGARGARAVVVSGGFGNGVATGNGGNGGNASSPGGGVQQGGFATVRAPSAEHKPRVEETAPELLPVEVLSKPNPVYTAEARQQKIEGEVLLEVVFEAAGTVRVVRVLNGLGHGLDEAAIRAAQQIHFKPARRAGAAVDSPAKLHIIFQLA
jgi:TonB family protein